MPSCVHCSGNHYDLESADGRQTTLDARNGTLFIYPVCDTDNHWTLAGYYNHDLVRTNGGWKIRNYTLNTVWTEGNNGLGALAAQQRQAS